MGGIHGIGALLEPINLKFRVGQGAPDREDRPPANGSGDTVQVSSEAARLLSLSGLSYEFDARRVERVAQARENIENGTHQILEVVQIVASRISKYIDTE